MRIALVSLLALATAGANAFAQPAANSSSPAAPTATTPAAQPAPAPAAAPATTPAPVPAPAPATPPAATTAPATPAATPAAPATGAPPATAANTPAPPPPGTPPAAGTPAPTTDAAATPPAAPTPPPPPAPPTDPTAIAVLDILQHVCIPSANGGNFQQLVKAHNAKKDRDNNWVIKTRDYTLTIEDPGSNPTQCHVDVTHPLDNDSPGKEIVVALNDWATALNGWSLYRNDKSVQAGMLVTTRSWTLDWNGKNQGLVFTNMRKPDGTPLKNGVDTSQVIYSVSASS